MTVTHNGRQYTVTKMADGLWTLRSVDKPREKISLTTQQMKIAGLTDALRIKWDL